MSTLLLNTLTGKTSAGSIVMTGEGGSTTTNMQQGLCKAWINFTGITTTAARDSFNMSIQTDVGAGQTTLAITNDMGNANYSGYYFTSAATGTAYSNFGNAFTGGFGSFAAGQCSVNAYTSTNFDSYQNLVGLFGDLA
jgi:hypothetical protein